MKIRYAKQIDLDFLMKGFKEISILENRYKEEKKEIQKIKKDYRKAIKNNNIRVIEIENNPVAFIYFKTNFKVMYMDSKFLWIQRIYVKKEHRGKGLAKILYRGLIEVAKKKGCKKIVGDIFEANKNSKLFHKKLGFKPVYTIYEKKI